MPPKQQDMSVRDEDQLARDQSLDQLKDQLRASLGYEGGADGLVSMESGELHRFMGELGDKIAEHDRLIVAPPWLAKLQAQVAQLEGGRRPARQPRGVRAEVLELRSALQGAARLARARRGARAGGVRRGAAAARRAAGRGPRGARAAPAGDLRAHPRSTGGWSRCTTRSSAPTRSRSWTWRRSS